MKNLHKYSKITSLYKRILFVFCAFHSIILVGQPTSLTVSTAGSGTYTIPSGYKASIRVQIWGGGGGSNGGTNGGRSGGGGGGYAEFTFIDALPQTFNYTVGAGGLSTDVNNTASHSSFTGALGTLTATGGVRGAASVGGAGGTGSGPVGGVYQSGGTGGVRSVDGAGGGGGGAAGPGGDGDPGVDAAGTTGGAGGAGNGGGSGGAGGNVPSGAGVNGSAPGGGGGGQANSVGAGRNGGVGRMIITVSNIMVLPVELVTFSAKSTDNRVQLDWQTASEKDNDHFAIERSKDGIYFESIGKVNGKGTVDFSHNYTYLDEKPLLGDSYYRLRQVDIDGTTDLSNVVVVNHLFKGTIDINYLPNSEVVRINTNTNSYSVQIVDMMGRNIKMVNTLKQSNEISIADLAQGNYRVIVRSDDGLTKAVNIFKP